MTLHGALMAWYREYGRHDLPWRLTRDPYAVLVSEVMLQQTQVERVRPYYDAWLWRWPDVETLAGESTAEVIRAWAGLGYNRRALNLQRAARVVAETGAFPKTVAGLEGLPGVGPYTARAVFSFAYEERVEVGDTNILRVAARCLLGMEGAKVAGAKAVTTALIDLLPVEGARDHNLALMDLGAMVCGARMPECGRCPLVDVCAWKAAGQPRVEMAGKGASLPFERTARFARGRIVDALRAGALGEAEVRRGLPEWHREQTAVYLAGLERDGMAVRDGEVWRLPD